MESGKVIRHSQDRLLNQYWALVPAGFTALALSVATDSALAQSASDEEPYRGTVHIVPASPGRPVTQISGVVFDDRNRDGIQQRQERGIRDVLVSDGLNVVKTGSDGSYSLPLPTTDEEMAGLSIFITKPDGYDVPLDEHNIPQFFYVHKPAGSPLNVRGEPFRYGGLEPTNALPAEINFPMVRGQRLRRFKIAVSGDTQTYSNTEIGYLRDSLAKELADRNDLQALIIEGDIMGDDLSLYTRFKDVMSLARIPQYYVPGNHDLDFDAPDDDHSFDTFRREWGPEYYSFEIGEVHFVVLDDVKYPCTPDEDNLDGLHGNGNQCDTPDTNPTYNGVITQRQLQWLRNNLALVPTSKLVVLNSHIPIYSFIDQNLARQMVDNVAELYEAVGCQRSTDGKTFRPENCERPLLALSGHTHTNEQIRPGETFEGWETVLDSGNLPPGRAVGASPFPQIVVGAASGSWWSGDFTDEVIPESWQRLGAPRGYYIFEFDGNQYKDIFKATGKPVEKQMSVDMLTPEFVDWFRQLSDWRNSNPAPDAVPPVNINDLPDTKIITLDGLNQTYLSVNVWNGSRDSVVYAYFDDREPIKMERTQAGEGENILETLDPYALKRQMQIARHAYASDSGEPRANGFELFQGSINCGTADPGACTPRPGGSFFWTDQSNHIWQVKLPSDLEEGPHNVKVVTEDLHGNVFEESLNFEVREARPPKYFQLELFEDRP
ncbi:MAG: phosphohydrolase [Candidatus Competibacteraceae bacterium]|nr:phosphohydrolase [Candidatus Competibacteraceae bacterium]